MGNEEVATYQKAIELAKAELARLRSDLAAAHELIAIIRDSRLRGEDWLEAALAAYDEQVRSTRYGPPGELFLTTTESGAECIAERAARVVGRMKRFGAE